MLKRAGLLTISVAMIMALFPSGGVASPTGPPYSVGGTCVDGFFSCFIDLPPGSPVGITNYQCLVPSGGYGCTLYYPGPTVSVPTTVGASINGHLVVAQYVYRSYAGIQKPSSTTNTMNKAHIEVKAGLLNYTVCLENAYVHLSTFSIVQKKCLVSPPSGSYDFDLSWADFPLIKSLPPGFTTYLLVSVNSVRNLPSGLNLIGGFAEVEVTSMESS
ncbi:MAG: hypothetical protein ABIS18_11240 [Actinomycetota bacterium]